MNRTTTVFSGKNRVIRRRLAGFTLIEMAIMLVVVGLIMGGGVNAIRAQMNKGKVEQSQVQMQTIQQALLGFVAVNGHLPCPDTDSDGNENTPCPDPDPWGQLPWKSLGIKPVDPWNRLYTYRVTSAYTAIPASPLLRDAADGDIVIIDGNKNLCPPSSLPASPPALVTNVPAVVISHGANGKGAYLLSHSPVSFTDATAQEKKNIIDTGNNPDNPAGAFRRVFCLTGDDVLMWLPLDMVKYRMVQSNWLH